MAAEARPSAAWRGEQVDIGGRALRVVRAGPTDAPGPLILLEHGAFGCAADWAVVQERLAARGLRSLAYDRAGLGHSDPGPRPRDGRAIVADAEALLAAVGETGPLVAVGHSMGGLMVRLFALTHPDRVLGLVLVDAMTPDVIDLPVGRRAIGSFAGVLRLAGVGAQFGLMRPVSLITGNLIGLTGDAAAEKRRIHGSAPHARGAADEVSSWPETSLQAGAHDLPPELPVAVVTAGGERVRPWLKKLQTVPAQGSQHGYVEHVAGSTHASLLGRRFADPVVRGVTHVLGARR
ncbi:alpha/beta fold hydrolase [Phenylobacterium sp.]|uniref:alpha/beta fold hydrolase n=1 Tax=Phenylobacterium sp. TaxID=1871053 RepID=UPI002F94B135